MFGVNLVGVDRNGPSRVTRNIIWQARGLCGHGALCACWGYPGQGLRIATQAARRLEQMILDRPEHLTEC